MWETVYVMLISLWTLARHKSVSCLDIIELTTGCPPFCLLQSLLSLLFLFDSESCSLTSIIKLDQCSSTAVLIILREMVGQKRLASLRCLLSSPWGTFSLFLISELANYIAISWTPFARIDVSIVLSLRATSDISLWKSEELTIGFEKNYCEIKHDICLSIESMHILLRKMV